MWPFAELGLEGDADERAVKRAYATRLRQTRPEDDPQGFQALHAAYQAALASCREREVVLDEGARPGASVPAAVESPAPACVCSDAAPSTVPAGPGFSVQPLPPARLDLGAFVQEAIGHAGAGDPAALERWLHGVEALWSLDTKAQAGHALISAIHDQAPAMPEACLDTLLVFFGLDCTLTGHDALALHQLRRRINLAWYLAPTRREQLASALRLTERSQHRVLEAALTQLQRPFRWWQVLLRGLHPVFAREVGALVELLCDGHLELLPAALDRRQLRFWLSAADVHSVGWPRLALAGTRVLVTLLLSLMLGLFFGLVAGSEGAIDPSGVSITMTLGLGLCAFFLAVAAWWQLVRWQAGSTPAGRWSGRLHTGLVPLLVGAGLTTALLAGTTFAGWPMLLAAVWLAVARALDGRRISDSLRLCLWLGCMLVSPVAHVLAKSGLQPAWFTGVFTTVALGAWGFDFWRRYRPWRPVRIR